MPPRSTADVVAEVMRGRSPGDTPEVLLQRVKERIARPPDDATPAWVQARETAGRGVSDIPPSGVQALVEYPPMQSAANPQTVGDMTNLLIPGQVAGAMRTAGTYAKAIQTGFRERPAGVGGLLKVPGKAIEALKRELPSGRPAIGYDRYMPNKSATPKVATAMEQAQADLQQSMGRTPTATSEAIPGVRSAQSTVDDVVMRNSDYHQPAARPTGPVIQTDRVPYGAPSEAGAATSGMPGAASEAAAAQSLSASQRADLVGRGYTPDVIAKIEQRMGARPMPAHVPTENVRASASPASPTSSGASATPIQAESAPIRQDLQGPRIQTGAERVGRSAGMTKQEVRQATGPIRNEARGDASPVLPDTPFAKMLDTLTALPKEGGARDAYVAAADPKTGDQLYNMLRQLRHFGMVIPAAAVPSVREQLMRMMSSHQSGVDQ